MIARSAWLSPLFAGCLAGTGEPFDLPEADFDAFVAEVQPALEVGCANPSCHGAADRPLEVYATRRHRLDPDDTHRDTPLTAVELALNFDRARGFLVDVDEPGECPLLYEPLSDGHAGGAIYEDPGEPGYLAIEAWVVAALAEAP